MKPLINQLIESDHKLKHHEELCDQIHETYRIKNADYGDSFGSVYRKLGMVSALTQITHKYERLMQLGLSDKQQVKDESLKDTLLDLANYCLMTVMEVEAHND